MRLRGKIENASVSYKEKFPIIIPLHGNVQSMLHFIRSTYWVIGARRAATSHVNHCVKCKRYRKEDRAQLMGDLPRGRLSSFNQPFYYCGVDFFGPIKLKRFEGRCRSIDTGYVAVFVCMTTKMIRLECVSNLTTERFLWALSRLISIYGTPAKLFSDNGKTFVGAANVLNDVMKTWMNDEVDSFLTTLGIQWRFICPKAPFKGGLWEAVVRSTKYHLKRVLGDYTMTFEQYYTLLSKITCVLNSRPLVAESDDPLNLNYLTPREYK